MPDAGCLAINTITDFDFTAQPTLDRAQIARLEGGGWLAEARNIVLLGPPGTGKTHLSTALAIAAAQAGHRSRSPPPPVGSAASPKRTASPV